MDRHLKIEPKIYFVLIALKVFRTKKAQQTSFSERLET